MTGLNNWFTVIIHSKASSWCDASFQRFALFKISKACNDLTTWDLFLCLLYLSPIEMQPIKTNHKRWHVMSMWGRKKSFLLCIKGGSDSRIKGSNFYKWYNMEVQHSCCMGYFASAALVPSHSLSLFSRSHTNTLTLKYWLRRIYA